MWANVPMVSRQHIRICTTMGACLTSVWLCLSQHCRPETSKAATAQAHAQGGTILWMASVVVLADRGCLHLLCTGLEGSTPA